MQSPVPLKLAKITLRRLLIMNLELIIPNPIKLMPSSTISPQPHLHLPQLLSSQPQRQLVTSPLVLEAIDASKRLSDGDVEDEVGKGEEDDGNPAVAALEAGGGGLGEEDEGEEEEEELEELLELLLLEVDGSLLLEGLLEVELDDGVEGLQGCLLWD